MLWEIDIHPAEDRPDRAAERVVAAARELGLADELRAAAAHGYLIQGDSLDRGAIDRLAAELLADVVVEMPVVGQVGEAQLSEPPQRIRAANACGMRNAKRGVSSANPQSEIRNPQFPAECVTVLLKPGVMDPVAQSALTAAADLGISAEAMSTIRKYWLAGVDSSQIEAVSNRLLANDAIEQVVIGPLRIERLHAGNPYEFDLRTVSLGGLDDEALVRLSRTGQLYLQLAEMQTIQRYFAELGRDPTDVELETIAQTWSEHCSHKTLAGRIAYRDEQGERQFDNMLKETIFAATQEIRRRLGDDDWCVSVFKDNAGVVRFDERRNLAFKVETHNHPSALEPYGGANTGIGGVIRDIMGTGLGAKPVANTDVFCFAPPTTPAESLPPGVLHPRRVMRGVVEGVRDYGNRMGIPTVNGAVLFDERYLGNPLVYCGTVGLLPQNMSFKQPRPNDLIVSVGGRTGRDGIHGATFSSAELTHESDVVSGGAVQIGNAIEEKQVLDVMLTARDRGLYHAVTDCGAGGFSSAVGEMGEDIGAEVNLETAPLKYAGLSYTEIWISEAQERMVLAVPEDRWPELRELCESESVEATVIGRFVPTGRLRLNYHGRQVADLDMRLLHDGRPPVVRQAVYTPAGDCPLCSPQADASPLPNEREKGTVPLSSTSPEGDSPLFANDDSRQGSTDDRKKGTVPGEKDNYNDDLVRILAAPNVASKQWIIRQYDHEVQGGSVVKPLVGTASDGPSDAAVVRPVLDSRRGMAISCGINPRYGELDTYHMAASAIDEAVRNCVAVGANPTRIAILDNFCWGDCERPETLGSLVRAALACHDVSLALGTPFVSGKDSLNNEFSYEDADGHRHTIAIPATLLVSAMGQVNDVDKCVTMDLKQPGNLLYLVGRTKDELGGSHFALVSDLEGGHVPTVDIEVARATFAAVHHAIQAGLVRACHDLSEGGLAVAAAEMAFAGGVGARIDLDAVAAADDAKHPAVRLFSESNTRLLCEVTPDCAARFEQTLADVPLANVGQVTDDGRLVISAAGAAVVDAEVGELKEAWQAPLRW